MSWLSFVHDYKIPYEKSGKNYIEIACCFCGIGHSEHKLALHLHSGKYKCWRDLEYRNTNPVRAVKELARCSWEEAKIIAEQYFDWNFAHKVIEKAKFSAVNYPVDKPRDFMSFGTLPALEEQFLTYLRSRNLDAKAIIARYNVHYAISGKYARRLILPVTFNNQWYCWTTRTIDPNEKYRYVSAGSEEIPNKINDFLFDEENLTGGKKLFITEGPFDAIKIASFLLPGIQSTSLFGQQVLERQLSKLVKLRDHYDEMYLALDQDAKVNAMKTLNQVRCYLPNLKIVYPPGKDFGECNLTQMKEILNDQKKTQEIEA